MENNNPARTPKPVRITTALSGSRALGMLLHALNGFQGRVEFIFEK